MLKLENTEVLGWEHAIRGMRNPMNSWEKSDSGWSRYCTRDQVIVDSDSESYFELGIGPNDRELMMRLTKGGPVHAKYRRMITVYVDITAPLYWWKEFDTYKVGTVANSCSTMHKIAAKEFTLEDFSHEHLSDRVLVVLQRVIYELNLWRNIYIEGYPDDMQYPEIKPKDKNSWWQMIQLLPSSYNQKRTVMLNYEVLTNIYHSRKNHKLDEWHAFCEWIEKLPYSQLITGESDEQS